MLPQKCYCKSAPIRRGLFSFRSRIKSDRHGEGASLWDAPFPCVPNNSAGRYMPLVPVSCFIRRASQTGLKFRTQRRKIEDPTELQDEDLEKVAAGKTYFKTRSNTLSLRSLSTTQFPAGKYPSQQLTAPDEPVSANEESHAQPHCQARPADGSPSIPVPRYSAVPFSMGRVLL